MDKLTPKSSNVFQANRDRAAPLLAKLKADGIGLHGNQARLPRQGNAQDSTPGSVNPAVIPGRE